jgi:hypothetical protein
VDQREPAAERSRNTEAKEQVIVLVVTGRGINVRNPMRASIVCLFLVATTVVPGPLCTGRGQSRPDDNLDLVRRRIAHDRDGKLPALHESQVDGVEGYAGREVARPADGIDEPAGRAVGRRLASALLPDHQRADRAAYDRPDGVLHGHIGRRPTRSRPSLAVMSAAPTLRRASSSARSTAPTATEARRRTTS